eukprot:m.45612 g.45612  ORF g.45612 m.45612 type:complete len:78 (+) comp13096_c0_seq1:1087-1320(+)
MEPDEPFFADGDGICTPCSTNGSVETGIDYNMCISRRTASVSLQQPGRATFKGPNPFARATASETGQINDVTFCQHC